jgi:hypothetical protein
MHMNSNPPAAQADITQMSFLQSFDTPMDLDNHFESLSTLSERDVSPSFSLPIVADSPGFNISDDSDYSATFHHQGAFRGSRLLPIQSGEISRVRYFFFQVAACTFLLCRAPPATLGLTIKVLSGGQAQDCCQFILERFHGYVIFFFQVAACTLFVAEFLV